MTPTDHPGRGAALHVFTNGTDWVVAEDVDDAWAAWSEHSGGERADYEDDWRWEQEHPAKRMTIACDETNGMPDIPDNDGVVDITMTMAEWAEKFGRGFLCSTEV